MKKKLANNIKDAFVQKFNLPACFPYKIVFVRLLIPFVCAQQDDDKQNGNGNVNMNTCLNKRVKKNWGKK